MDNGDKIKKLEKENKIHKEVLLFLGDELDKIHKTSRSKNYNIVEEYEKTQKNRSPFVLLVLLGCLLGVFLTAFIMQKVINVHDKEIEVSLTEFDDLNLRSLLNSVSSVQANYDNAVKNRGKIQIEWTSQLEAIQTEKENEIYVVDSMKLKNKKDYENRIRLINENAQNKRKAVDEEFQAKIQKADRQIEEYKKQLDRFDENQVKSARQNELAVDSNRQVQQLEIQKISKDYEERISELEETLQQLRKKNAEDVRNTAKEVAAIYQARIDLLDPVINDQKASEIIQSASGVKKFDAEQIAENNEITDERFVEYLQGYQEIYGKYEYLDKAVSSVPQENSIPKYVASSRALVDDMGQSFSETTVSYYQEKNQLEGEIEKSKSEKLLQQEKYETALDNLMTVAKTNAVILDAREVTETEIIDEVPVETVKKEISIYVSPKARYLITENGADAEFKADKVVKGKIKLSEDGTYFFVQSPEKDGSFINFNISAAVPGLSVKILSK